MHGDERGGLGRKAPIASVRAMAIHVDRVLGFSRNAVRRTLDRDALPWFVREPRGSIVDVVEREVQDDPAIVFPETYF